MSRARAWPAPSIGQEELAARAKRLSELLVEAVRNSQKEAETMGAFNINITGVGGHGCERKAKPGEKLFGRCGRFTCPDCAAYDFVQRLKQAGMLRDGDTATGQEVVHSPACPATLEGCTCGAVPPGAEIYHTDADGRITDTPPLVGSKTYWRKRHQALFTHWPDSPTQVVDDMLKNERRSGQF
jgi:hypothetical protein